ncbi:hypothetical protein B0T09DRAFT_134712 [Sordaria sp. MPI-SDFR-AT-0083]|nr:hypothetical protein B0T09DRAFT_134712 [Sordaria sp. MPI-SDFR-AT-0083]
MPAHCSTGICAPWPGLYPVGSSGRKQWAPSDGKWVGCARTPFPDTVPKTRSRAAWTGTSRMLLGLAGSLPPQPRACPERVPTKPWQPLVSPLQAPATDLPATMPATTEYLSIHENRIFPCLSFLEVPIHSPPHHSTNPGPRTTQSESAKSAWSGRRAVAGTNPRTGTDTDASAEPQRRRRFRLPHLVVHLFVTVQYSTVPTLQLVP